MCPTKFLVFNMLIIRELIDFISISFLNRKNASSVSQMSGTTFFVKVLIKKMLKVITTLIVTR